MKTFFLSALLLAPLMASAETSRGYFNEKGEMVYLYRNGEAMKAASRKPASIAPDTRNLFFQEDKSENGDPDAFRVRCYYSLGANNTIVNLNCIKIK